MTTILLSAGDASGEAYAADLVRALRERMPEARFVGLGGREMAAAGVELIVDQGGLAVGGLFEIAGSLGRIIRTWRAMTKGLREARPDLVVLVDSGGFNLPFARYVRGHSNARVLYYIAPQIWAWRAGRLRKLVARSDRIAVLFPFERDFYRAHGVEVELVGHPMLDRGIAAPVDSGARARARSSLGIAQGVPLLGILPGSRRNEVERHLPLQLAAFAKLREDTPELEAVIGLAPSLDADRVRAIAEAGGSVGTLHFAPGDPTLLDAIDVAVAKPGTVTVELMLRERPMVVIGRVHPLTAALLGRGLEAQWLAMPNLVAGAAIVPELMQSDATPDRIAAAIAPLLPERRSIPDRADSARTDPERATRESLAAREQIQALRRARSELGTEGATVRVVQLVEEMLGTASS